MKSAPPLSRATRASASRSDAGSGGGVTRGRSLFAPWICSSSFIIQFEWWYKSRIADVPSRVSTSKQAHDFETPVARRSPWVRAPSDCSRLTTAAQKRRSPPSGDTNSLYSGADAWFARWDRPICCSVLSADHGSSSVMWTRRLLFLTRACCSACKDIPDDAASEMIAISFSPRWNSSRSCKFCSCMDRPFSVRFCV